MTLDLSQRWILALSAPLVERNGDDHERVGGAERPFGSLKAANILTSAWSVRTSTEATQCLTWLADEGHRGAYAAQQAVAPTAFFGWDFGRLAMVAGWSYLAYLIELDEAWGWMKRAALAVKPVFGSFAELGQSYLRGLRAWASDDKKPVEDLERSLADLISREGSPFQIPWNVDVSAAAPPASTARTVRVAASGSIAAAIAEAGPNGRVILAPGAYRETIVPPHPIELVAETDGAVSIEGAHRPALFTEGHGVAVRGIALKGALTEDGKSLNAASANGGYLRLDKCDLEATHNGIFVSKEAMLHLIDSVVHDCGRHAVHVEPGNFLVQRGEIKKTGFHGIARFSGKFLSIIEGTHVSGVARTAIVSKGRVAVRDALVEGAGEYGIANEGELTCQRSTVRDAGGWALAVQDGEAYVESATFEKSGQANVAVIKGFCRLHATTLQGAGAAGLVLQAAARALLTECTIADNKQGNIFAIAGAKAVMHDTVVRGGGGPGVWTQGADLRFFGGSIEDAIAPAIHVLGEGHAVFCDVNVHDNGQAGIVVGDGATARFSRCTVEKNGDAGLVVHENAKPVFEDCEVRDNAAPDRIDASAQAVFVVSAASSTGTLPELAAIDPSEDGYAFPFPGHATVDAAFRARTDRPSFPLVARALVHKAAEEVGDLGAIAFLLSESGMLVQSGDKALLHRVRQAFTTALADAREFRKLVDHEDGEAASDELARVKAP